MIKINSATDITNKFTKILGFGEQSVVGLLEDGKNVAKCFRAPHDFTDKYDLLIGSKINQTSFCFLMIYMPILVLFWEEKQGLLVEIRCQRRFKKFLSWI